MLDDHLKYHLYHFVVGICIRSTKLLHAAAAVTRVALVGRLYAYRDKLDKIVYVSQTR